MQTNAPSKPGPSRKATVGLAGVALAVLGTLGYALSTVQATPPEGPNNNIDPQAAPVVAAADADDVEAKPDVAKATVTVVVSVYPSVPAFVSWGKKKLGRIEPGKPLVVTRPRDSGPLDLAIKANGFLPVTTRAHTFNDHKLQVRLTRPDATAGMVGYRVPIVDAGVPGEDMAAPADAGVSVDFGN
jgi:hypothetical protein